MLKTKFIFVLLISITFLFIGCDKSTEPEEKPEEAFEKSLTQMDLTMASMTTSKMFLAFLQMPDSLIDMPSFPLSNFVTNQHSLSKNIVKRDFTSADSSILSFFDGLERLYGTHIYDGSKWNHSSSPSDEVVIQYPFVDISTNQTQQMYIRIYGIIKSQILLQFSMEAKIDNVRKFYLEYAKIEGTSLLSTQPNPLSLSFKGEFIDDNNKKALYEFNMNNSQITFSFTPSGMEAIAFSVTGEEFFAMDSAQTNLSSVSIEQGKMKIVITEFNSTNGDIGDVFYRNKKIADVWLVDEQPYIYYTNGKQVALSELMPIFGQFANGL